MNLTEKAKSQISEIILSALGALVADGKISAEPLPAFATETTGNPEHGDFSCNCALVSAKTLGKAPRAIAELIQAEAEKRLGGTVFDRVETAGPGFLNFFAGSDWFSEAVAAVLEQGGDYGRVNAGGGKRVLIEFVSANPTGPMHIGNARGGALGDCLASVLEFAGYSVEREFYVNDAGNQIEKFGLSLDLRYKQELGLEVEMPEESYKGEDITAHARNFIALYGDKYLSASEEERRAALTEYALPLNIRGLEEDLGKYRIKYDTWFKESALHEKGAPMKVVELLKEKGQTYEKDGAVWFKASDFGDEKDRVLVRSNGIPTYVVPDIAYHYNKLTERGFDIAVDILGADHHGYVARMNAALTALGIDNSRLKVIIMQMVRLVRKGETVKLSKRSGKAITLTSLLDEVPVDAARFFFNMRSANTHLDFDLDLAIEENSKNPVYYVQYAHARICSVFRRLAEEGITRKADFTPVYAHPKELALIHKLSEFPAVIGEAAREFDPSRLTNYIYETAQFLHRFYDDDNCKIKGQEETILQSRLALTEATRVVIRNALNILKVEAPEKM